MLAVDDRDGVYVTWELFPSPARAPRGLGFEKIPSFSMLMQENRDARVFANMGGMGKRR